LVRSSDETSRPLASTTLSWSRLPRFDQVVTTKAGLEPGAGGQRDALDRRILVEVAAAGEAGGVARAADERRLAGGRVQRLEHGGEGVGVAGGAAPDLARDVTSSSIACTSCPRASTAALA
jgi:hypothetical protein